MMKQTSTTDRLTQLLFELGRVMKQETAKEGFGPASFLRLETLRFIGEQKAPDMSALAEYLKVARPSATALANALAGDGLLERRPDPDDRRRVLLTLSKKGTRFIAEAAKKRTRAFARVVEPLSASERADLIRLITTMTHTQ